MQTIQVSENGLTAKPEREGNCKYTRPCHNFAIRGGIDTFWEGGQMLKEAELCKAEAGGTRRKVNGPLDGILVIDFGTWMQGG